MQADFERRCAAHDGGILVMYTHPCRLVTEQFWDSVNFARGADPPREQWRPAPLRPPEKIEALKRDFDAFLGWVVRQPGVELTTYSALHAAHRQPPAPWVGRDELLRLARAAGEAPAPVRSESQWLSPAELFGLVARALAASADTGRLPEAVAVRRLLGPTEPTPEPTVLPAEVPLADFLAAARAADLHATRTGAMPARLNVGPGIGPNLFLQTARSLLDALETGAAPRLVRLRLSSSTGTAIGEETALAQRPAVRQMRFRDGWSIFPADFEGRNVIEMARRQTWTGKPAAG
jgi:hypothetical protein